MKTPKFKREQFQNYHEHLHWISNHTKHRIAIIYGKNTGEEIRVHGSGEIVGCLTDNSKLIGQFIDLSRIEVGKHLYLYDNATSQYIKTKFRTEYIFPEKESTKENDCETIANEDEFNFESSIEKLSNQFWAKHYGRHQVLTICLFALG